MHITSRTLIIALLSIGLWMFPGENANARKRPAASSASTWTESWADTSGWDPITQQCSTVNGGQLTMICQSAALQSKATWDATQSITLSGVVSGEPAPGSSTPDYWAGLVLFQDDNHYAELATERHVPPDYSTTPHLMTLTPYGAVVGNGQSGQTYQFTVAWDPGRRQVRYSVDGTFVRKVKINLSGPLRIWVLCASVGEGVLDNGSAARCMFGPVTLQTPA